MGKYKKIIVFITTGVLFLLAAPKSALAECSQIVVDPTSGFETTLFTAATQNCDLSTSSYEVRVIKGGSIVKTGTFQDIGNKRYVAIISEGLTEGAYTFLLYNKVTSTGLSAQSVQVASTGGNTTTEYRCDTVTYGRPICLKCTVNPDNTSGCVTATNSELSSCPSTCRASAATTTTGGQVNFEGKCTPSGQATNTGIQTAIGCVPFASTTAIATFFLRWALGIGGGLAFLLIVYAGFLIMTSSGNPSRLQGGQELMTSAISGLVMIIFSIFILRILGVNILGLF